LSSLKPSSSSIDVIVQKIDELNQKIDRDAAAAIKSVELLRKLLWVSWGLHVPEWIALVWLWMERGS
jgi:hypothetical protein